VVGEAMQVLQEEFQFLAGERLVVSVVSHTLTLRLTGVAGPLRPKQLRWGWCLGLACLSPAAMGRRHPRCPPAFVGAVKQSDTLGCCSRPGTALPHGVRKAVGLA
jgi:hypothetical protein